MKSSGPARCPCWKTNTRTPNVALSVSRFISNALMGSTTEPVMNSSTTSAVPTSRVNASGSRWPMEVCWSM